MLSGLFQKQDFYTKPVQMKKSPYTAFLLMIICLSCKNEQPKDNRDASFKEDLKVHLEAIESRNYDALEPTVAEDVLIIGPDGSHMDSKYEFMKFHKQWFALPNWKWKGTVLTTASSDSLSHALVRYNYTENDSLGIETHKSEAYLLLIFRKGSAGWQLIHDQNTTIRP